MKATLLFSLTLASALAYPIHGPNPSGSDPDLPNNILTPSGPTYQQGSRSHASPISTSTKKSKAKREWGVTGPDTFNVGSDTNSGAYGIPQKRSRGLHEVIVGRARLEGREDLGGVGVDTRAESPYTNGDIFQSKRKAKKGWGSDWPSESDSVSDSDPAEDWRVKDRRDRRGKRDQEQAENQTPAFDSVPEWGGYPGKGKRVGISDVRTTESEEVVDTLGNPSDNVLVWKG